MRKFIFQGLTDLGVITYVGTQSEASNFFSRVHGTQMVKKVNELEFKFIKPKKKLSKQTCIK